MASPQEIDDIRRNSQQRDMILAPNEYAFISDETKGEVNCFVGPNKTSLAGTDRPVTFDTKVKRFMPVGLDRSIQTFQTAPEGWYVILKNPAVGDKHPTQGKLTTPELRVGKKINISGPASFALWPGQMSKVIQGHNLRSNEYLLVRVYDEEAARANFAKAVIKSQAPSQEASQDSDVLGSSEDLKSKGKNKRASGQSSSDASLVMTEEQLTMGKLFVIRGTDVSFYIPSTGLEVVPEKVNGEDRFVREAVTLERLEYCLLLDQNGNKRYVHGPDVVFPRPTEKFVDAPIKSNPEKAKAKKFRAQELTAASGIHIRVIADYVDDRGIARAAGEELFITGKEQTIYFPREEHAIVKYNDQDIHYGIAIPEGEARYVLDRNTGVISIERGPQIFLPDPRTQVIAQRALSMDLCALLYPGNAEALEINAARLGIDNQDIYAGSASNATFSADASSYEAVGAVVNADTSRRIMIKGASKTLPGDAFDRKNKFTAPRSLVLNTKYDGPVSTTLWTGYSMLLVSKSGERRVVHGPGTFMFEYDEAPQVIELSTGKPKNTDKLFRTVFLKNAANMVTDVVEVETQDFCKLNVKLIYRVNFEGDSARWFNIDNYVKFLCDHMRSKIRSQVQKLGVEEFYKNHAEILRNIVLGEGAGEKRAGQLFSENGMRIYDLEVLTCTMQNTDVEKLLVSAQRDVIQNTLTLDAETRRLEQLRKLEDIRRETAVLNAETKKLTLQHSAEEAQLTAALELVKIDARAKTTEKQLEVEAASSAERAKQALATANAEADVESVALMSARKRAEEELTILREKQELTLEKLTAEAEAVVTKAAAITPDLVAALSAFGDKALIEKLSESMAPLSILGGTSVVDVAKQLLAGTSVAKHLESLPVVANGVNKVANALKS